MKYGALNTSNCYSHIMAKFSYHCSKIKNQLWEGAIEAGAPRVQAYFESNYSPFVRK